MSPDQRMYFIISFLLVAEMALAEYVGTCPYYFTENTASATQAYYACYFLACPGDLLVIGSCGSVSQTATCGGDQFLRLFDGGDPFASEVAYDDDGCGSNQQCSRIVYTVPAWTTCRNYYIHEGCYEYGKCGAVVEVSRYSPPTFYPTLAPTVRPSIRPTVRPSFRPTIRPSLQPISHPTGDPTTPPQPTLSPSAAPTLPPAPEPTTRPSIQPISHPTQPSLSPSVAPALSPAPEPSYQPTSVTTSPPSAPNLPTQAPTSPAQGPSDISIIPIGGTNSDSSSSGEVVGIVIACVVLGAIILYLYNRRQDWQSILPAQPHELELGPRVADQINYDQVHMYVMPSAPPMQTEQAVWKCKVCMGDTFTSAEGFECPNRCGVFTCWACMRQSYAAAAKPNAPKGRSNEDGFLLCSNNSCKFPINVADLSNSRAPREILQSQQEFIVNVQHARGVAAGERSEINRREAEEKRERQMRNPDERIAERLRKRIVEEILTLSCPHCKTAFSDFDDCFALRCSNNFCRHAFCAWCLQDCGEDAHAHVVVCPENQGRGVYNQQIIFEQHHTRKRTVATRRLIESYMLSDAAKARLRDLLSPNLRHLNISPDEVFGALG